MRSEAKEKQFFSFPLFLPIDKTTHEVRKMLSCYRPHGCRPRLMVASGHVKSRSLSRDMSKARIERFEIVSTCLFRRYQIFVEYSSLCLFRTFPRFEW